MKFLDYLRRYETNILKSLKLKLFKIKKKHSKGSIRKNSSRNLAYLKRFKLNKQTNEIDLNFKTIFKNLN